jgi:TetR/AcrR family transcriptional regulator, transcriptional repressor for nem operon
MPRQTDSKTKLLESALELIWLGSYNSVSVDQICAACDIKKGSFYHHFPSKESLTVAALEHGWQNYKTHLDAAFSPLARPLDRIKAFLRSERDNQTVMFKKRGFVCGCPHYALGAEIGTREPAIRAKIEELLCRTAKYFETTIREGHALGEFSAADAKKVAWEVLTYWEGTITLARIRNDLQVLTHVEDGILRLLRPQKASAAA